MRSDTLSCLLLGLLQVAGNTHAPGGPVATSSTLTGHNLGRPSPTEATEPKPATNATSDFIIGFDDVLAINVWREPDVSKVVVVRPDGKISLPLIGEITANGSTPIELQRRIATQLEPLIARPEVTVIVQEIRSQRFNILGEVAKPGVYPLIKSMTVLDAIGIAGGLKDFAKPTKMYLIRRQPDGSTSKIAFNYKKAVSGLQPAQNQELQPRDTIVVP